MRVVEKTTKSGILFVENADFLQKREGRIKKPGDFFKKRLTTGASRVIITKQMKQNSRSHPAAEGAQRLIRSPLGYF